MSRFREKLSPANWVQGVTAISRKISRSWAPKKWGPTCVRDISNSAIYTTAICRAYTVQILGCQIIDKFSIYSLPFKFFDGDIKLHFTLLLNEMASGWNLISWKGKNLSLLITEYHGCWWPGNVISQGISSHDTDFRKFTNISALPSWLFIWCCVYVGVTLPCVVWCWAVCGVELNDVCVTTAVLGGVAVCCCWSCCTNRACCSFCSVSIAANRATH